MPSEESSSKFARWSHNILQLIGAGWTLAYAVMVYSYESFAGDSDGHFWFELIVFWAPNACMLLTFAFLRTGGILAFIVLGLATVAQLSEAPADLRGSPQVFSMLIMLVGGPIALARGDFVYRHRHRKSDADP